MDTCVLLSARSYDFKDDQGRSVQGVTLSYLTGDVETTGDRRGVFAMSINAQPEIFAQLGPVPGIYDMDFKQRPGPKGKPVLQVVGLKFKAPLTGMLAAADPGQQQGQGAR